MRVQRIYYACFPLVPFSRIAWMTFIWHHRLSRAAHAAREELALLRKGLSTTARDNDRRGDPDPSSAGTAGDAARRCGSSAAVGMAANPPIAHKASMRFRWPDAAGFRPRLPYECNASQGTSTRLTPDLQSPLSQPLLPLPSHLRPTPINLLIRRHPPAQEAHTSGSSD